MLPIRSAQYVLFNSETIRAKLKIYLRVDILVKINILLKENKIMTTIIINGRERKFDGDVTINIFGTNMSVKPTLKKPVEEEKFRTVNPIRIYDNIIDATSEYPRVKDFAMSLGYSPNVKAGLNTLLSLSGISDRYSNVTPKNMKSKKISVKELDRLDSGIYPIIPILDSNT